MGSSRALLIKLNSDPEIMIKSCDKCDHGQTEQSSMFQNVLRRLASFPLNPSLKSLNEPLFVCKREQFSAGKTVSQQTGLALLSELVFGHLDAALPAHLVVESGQSVHQVRHQHDREQFTLVLLVQDDWPVQR